MSDTNLGDHISSAYDRELEEIQTLMMKMGGLVEAAILDASACLEARDIEQAEIVRAADKKIDALEEEINDATARVIALRAPVSRDLRALLAVLKIAANLERVGDYAKNMAKRTFVLAEMPRINGADASLRRMAKEVQSMLNSALDAYIRNDAELAEAVRARDLDVDQMYNALFREFLTFMMEDPRSITPCMHLHFIAKNTERMGDHVTSIAEQVIYLVTGEYPEESRPKGDVTSTDVSVS